MERQVCRIRPDWATSCEAIGFDFHTFDAAPYWHEGAYWRFSAAEIDKLDDVAAELHKMCLQAVEEVISSRKLHLFGITGATADLVTESWRRREPALYGRFDLAWDGTGPPKMLEYNADTPTCLLEPAIVQHYWKEEVVPGVDQFNSLDERLTERFGELLAADPDKKVLHLSCMMPHLEDEGNIKYLAACAEAAGFECSLIAINDIGWDSSSRKFVDLADRPIERLFKLYPWEWLAKEEFAGHILESGTQFLEPAWKMLLSNKALLVQLWDMFPDHPNLLPAALNPEYIANQCPDGMVRKALLGREGANVTIFGPDGQQIADHGGAYGEDGYVWQGRAQLARVGEHGTAVLGVWMIGDTASGLGIRETDGPITTDDSRFVPHVFDINAAII